jgi:hypothetical protein
MKYRGTEGQDRDNYTDTQDRDSYMVTNIRKARAKLHKVKSHIHAEANKFYR